MTIINNPPDMTEVEFDGESILRPLFRLEEGIHRSVPYRDLYLQTFRLSPENSDKWLSQATEKWHLLARLYPGEIAMYPVHTNPYAMRYLTPKHGRFETIVFRDNNDNSLPESADAAISDIEIRLLGGGMFC